MQPSPEPFASYPIWRPEAAGADSRRQMPPRVWLEAPAVYRAHQMRLLRDEPGDTYEQWLTMAYDHVVPSSVCSSHGLAALFSNDIINHVLTCAECNGFKNRWAPEEPFSCPTTVEAFVGVRDRIFAVRCKRILERRELEERFHEHKLWEQRVPCTPVSEGSAVRQGEDAA